MEKYIVPPIVESQSKIVCLLFRQAYFQLRTDVINMFRDELQSFGRATENLSAHISIFLDMSVTIKYSGVTNEAIWLRLIPYTLRDLVRKWLDTFPPDSITTWNNFS